MKQEDDFSSIISDQADRLFRELLTREVLERANSGLWDEQLWNGIEESCLSSALVPEESGGVGLAPADAFEIIRLCGYRAVPLPLAESIIAKALWSIAGGDASLMPSGPVVIASPIGDLPLGLRKAATGVVLTGSLAPTAYASHADGVLLHAADETGAGHLVLLETPSLSSRTGRNLASEICWELEVDGAQVPPSRSIGLAGSDPRVLQAHDALMRAVQMTGAMQRCLELSLAYANERVQFGRAIAKFPAVQDMLVEAAGETSAALNASALATDNWTAVGDPGFVLRAAIAKSRCGEAAGKVAALAHQVHGAIGFTQEHILHHFTRRLWTWRDEFGSEAFWNEQIGRQFCAAGGGAMWPQLTDL